MEKHIEPALGDRESFLQTPGLSSEEEDDTEEECWRCENNYGITKKNQIPINQSLQLKKYNSLKTFENQDLKYA